MGVSVLKVKVEYLGYIKKKIGSEREEEVAIKENALVADLLSVLSREYGESFRKAVYEPNGIDVKSNFIVTVNGYLLNQLNGIETRLKDGDRVVIMPIVSGG